MDPKYIPAFNFHFLTPLYDFILNVLGFGVAEREKIVNLLNLHANENLLDIGCGTGSLLLVAKTAKDNFEGMLPTFLKQAGFEYKEISPKYRGINYFLARKN